MSVRAVLSASVLGAVLASAGCAAAVPVPGYVSPEGSTPTASAPVPPPDPSFSGYRLTDAVAGDICSALEDNKDAEFESLIFQYATPEVPPIAVGLMAIRQSCPELAPPTPAPVAEEPVVNTDGSREQTSGESQLEYLCSQDPSMTECL